MKKTLFLFVSLITVGLCVSCSQDNLEENNSIYQLETRSMPNTMSVEDGTLIFSSYEVYQQVYKELLDLRSEELANWNSMIGYVSMLVQESYSPNRHSLEGEDMYDDTNELELDPVRKALYSNRGLLIISDTIYKALGEYIYKVPMSNKEKLADIDANPEAYKDIRFKHTYVLTAVPSSSEFINGIEYKDAVDKEKRSARTPLTYVTSSRREHVKFIANVYSDSHEVLLKFGLVGRAQKKKIGIWGNTFNDEMRWGQGFGDMYINQLPVKKIATRRLENVKENTITLRIAPKGFLQAGSIDAFFDCYKNDKAGEEHYKCKFILN